jgi:hypothetical protein
MQSSDQKSKKRLLRSYLEISDLHKSRERALEQSQKPKKPDLKRPKSRNLDNKFSNHPFCIRKTI